MYQLIIFKDREPIIVSDEKIKIGDIVVETLIDGNIDLFYIDTLNDVDTTRQKKIIAGIPELPSIDFSALSEEDCKKIGWVDVELETYIIDSGDNGSRELSITNNSVKIINYDRSKHG